MSEASDKEQQQGPGLPDPELNPLTNPLLAKNMGRWAEVYFTNPPEKREEAVQELLRELRSKEVENTETAHVEMPEAVGSTPPESTASTIAAEPIASRESEAKSDSNSSDANRESSICPACLHNNRPDDRYCGLCGFLLKPAEKQQPPPAKRVESGIAQRSAPIERPPIERTEDGWEWLREKNLATFQVSTEPSSSAWKYAAGLGVLALVAAGVWGLWGRASARPKPSSATGTSTPSTVHVPPTQTPVPPPQLPEQPAEESKTAPPTSAEEQSSPSAADAQPNATQDGPSAVETQQAADNVPPDAGLQELSQAKRYLAGRGVPKSSTAAAALLWKSVAKENSEAVLLLSDLYVRGDGVPQSCDQARLLLSAAAKRGSAEAGEKLAILQNAGCR